MNNKIELDQDIFAVAFNPASSNDDNSYMVAAGLINGFVSCHKASFINSDLSETATKLFDLKCHKGSCRSIEFALDGSHLFTAGKDKVLQVIDVATGKPTLRKLNAHSDALSAIKVIDGNMVVTGDDSGVIKLWDMREKKMIRKYSENEDYISGFAYLDNILLAASADGRLSVFDIRKSKSVKISDNQDDELLCVEFVKNGKKAVVGSQEGVLSLFSYGNWGDCTDRIPGHPGSIDALVKLNESTIATGSDDGIVRVVGILPNKLIKVLPGHEDLNSPIERLAISADQNWIAGCSHDKFLRFWDSSEYSGLDIHSVMVNQDSDSDDSDVEAVPTSTSSKRKEKERDESSNDDDDSFNNDSDDDNDSGKRRKKKKKLAKKGIGGEHSNMFFADLE